MIVIGWNFHLGLHYREDPTIDNGRYLEFMLGIIMELFIRPL
jgi:hypothetical protein